MRKIVFPVGTLLLALLAAYLGYQLTAVSPRATGSGHASDTTGRQCSLARTSLRDAAGRPLPGTDWRGQVVLLNFWASWCGHCRMEMPALEQISREYHDRGVRVIGVAVDHPQAAEAFAHEVGADYPMLYGLDAAHTLLDRCAADAPGLPVSVVLDHNGKLCASHIGGLERQGFIDLLRPCLSPNKSH